MRRSPRGPHGQLQGIQNHERGERLLQGGQKPPHAPAHLRHLLPEHLERLEEARRRDHRKLGRELGLFCIDESVGQGLILWKPKGALIRRSLQDFITEELDKLGYSQVYTPNIGKLDLYRTSGHFPYYQESQYAPIPERDAMEKLSQEGASCAELFNGLATGTIEGYMLKPMNCPHHIKIYANDAHSYRDLPVRLARCTAGNRAESWAA